MSCRSDQDPAGQGAGTPSAAPELSRRTFLRSSVLAGGGLLLATCAPGPAPVGSAPPPAAPPTASPSPGSSTPAGATTALPKPTEAGLSRVVVLRDPAVLTPPRAIRVDALRQLLFAGLCRLTGAPDVRTALGTLVRPGQRVGLKVNCLAGEGLSTHPELVRVLADGLREAGIRRRDILVWDRSDRDLVRAGFTLQRGGDDLQVRGTDQAYEREISEAGSVGGCLSRLLTEECDVVINLPILKDHDLAGLSGCMKNFYGAIHNPNKYHDGNCSPYVADLYSLPRLRRRVVLHVYDALRPQYHGGPAYVAAAGWPMGGLILATDPVAADGVAWRILEQERQRHGLRSLTDEQRSPAGWLRRAAALGLGRLGPAGVEEVSI